MVALFKTHYSIGKSILSIDDLCEIQSKHDLKEMVVVEDSFYGFRSLNKNLQDRGVKLIFGIRLSVVNEKSDELPSKLIFFAKDNEGVKQIKALYTKSSDNNGILVFKDLGKELLSNVKIGVPFYDSFVYNNIFHFGLCNVELNNLDYFFFYENNEHPFDSLILDRVKFLSEQQKKPLVLSKSIYYKNRNDFDAFQMYKSICNRSQGKSPTFDNPNLNHFCSSEFCWQSFLDNATL